LTIRPAPLATRCGRAALEAFSVVITLRRCSRSQVDTSPSATVSQAKPPATLIRTSIAPHALAMSAIAAAAAPASDRSTPPLKTAASPRAETRSPGAVAA
jgi:hypothetical protein